jgi:SAM-dependent methyltransferase
MEKTSHLRAAWSWSLDSFDSQGNAKAWSNIKGARYPFKMLRYWFMYHMIREESAKLGRHLRCAEIGIDKGQMLYFIKDAGFKNIECWTGIDIKIKAETEQAGYTDLVEANVESNHFALDGNYDVVILLHVLEHLYEPEKFVARIARNLRPGAIIIGGFPVIPHFLVNRWQKRLRAIMGSNGHVSAFSPYRVKHMAADSGMNIEFMSGAFMFRKSGSFLEQSRLWMRINLLYGAVFIKALGSEVYWMMRK